MELHLGQTTHRWFGRFLADSAEGRRTARLRDPKTFGKCDHAISLKGATSSDYEIGVCRKVDGSPGYDLVYDSYGPGHKLEQAAGKEFTRLRDYYNARVGEQQMARQGYRSRIYTDAQGTVNVECVRV